MKCINCGNEILNSQKFCPECGQPIINPIDDNTSNASLNTNGNVAQPVQNMFDQAMKPLIIGIAILFVLIGGGLVFLLKGKDNAENNSSDIDKNTVTAVDNQTTTSNYVTDTTQATNREYRTDISYDNLARTPDEYKNEFVQMSGEVIQVIEDNGETDLRVAIDGDYSDVVLAAYDSSITDKRVLEYDEVIIYGMSGGLYTYQSTLGGDITVPLIYVDKIEIISENDITGGSDIDGGDNTDTATVSDDNFDVVVYDYKSYGTYYEYLIITNNSNAAVGIAGKATAYDADNNIEGIADGSIDIIGPGETSILYFMFWDLAECDHIEYALSYDTSTYYDPVIGNLSYETTENKKNIIVQVTNNGKEPAEFVEAYAVLFDKKGKVVNVFSQYITDSDYEIKPGETISEQISTFNSYDHAEIYFTGRHSKW